MKLTFPVITDDLHRLPFYLTGIGMQPNQEHIARETGFHCFHWLQCTGGVGKLIIDSREFEITQNMAFFFRPGIPHEYYATREPWITKWMIFDGGALPDLLGLLGFHSWEVFNFMNDESMGALIDEIYIAVQSENSDRYIECSSLLYAFLLRASRWMHSNIQHTKPNKYNKLQPLILFLEEMYSSDISLEDMARKIDVTTSYLCRLFNRTYSMSPFAYLGRLRIQKAKELLIEAPVLPVQTVAEQVGYHSTSYFCAVFKEAENCTPMQFRQMHGIGGI